MANLINDNSFRLVIAVNTDNGIEYYESDIISNVNVNASSTITTQPIVNGDVIADHMFREPVTMTIAGSFSLNGNKATEYSGATDRLAAIEQTFENIKNNGLFCTLTTMNRSNSSITRFLQRENMVLTGINWTEHQNSLDFNFNFNEAITIDVYESTATIADDENLPDITDATSLDFTDQFLDTEVVLTLIVKTLVDYELIDADFLEYFNANIGQDVLIGLGIGVAAAATIIIITGTITAISTGTLIAAGSTTAAILASAGPVGWGIGITAVVACVVVAGIATAIKAEKKRQAEALFTKTFKLYDNDELKNEQEIERFANYLAQVYENLEVLEDYCQIYGISTNVAQECMLYVDDAYYIFKFEKNNTTGNWSCSVTDVNSNQQGQTIVDMSSCISDITKCNNSNRLFTTSSGYSVYLMSLAENKVGLQTDDGTTKSLSELQKDLTNYVMLVAQIDMQQFSNVLSDLVINAMKKAS